MNAEHDKQRLQALEGVIAEYEAALLRYAVRLINRYDVAQNAVQDAFIKLYRQWPGEMKPAPNLSSWLYRVVHNAAIDSVRQETRLGLLHFRHWRERDELQPPDIGGDEPTDAAECVQKALASLALRDRELIILKVYEEKSYAEIAEITGLTVGNVGFILHHAMKKLAEQVRRIQSSAPSRNKS